jgi:cysteine desulfurase/selenocysteine lyase
MVATILDEISLFNIRDQIVGLDKKVPILDGTTRTYINFDNAASTPMLSPVLRKVSQFLEWYSSVHRGTGFKSQLSSQIYDQVHEIVADFVGANKESNTVILVKNTTEAINKLARTFPFEEGDIVLTSLMEHHSNDLPWRKAAKVIHIPVKSSGELDESQFDLLLQKYAGRVKLVTIAGASNVTGYINPIHRLAEKSHAVGAKILIDAAQLIAHRKIEMLPDDHPAHLDFLAFSAHKMYAPLGSGALIGGKDYFLAKDPESVGGGTVKFVGLKTVRWTDLPDREEPGSPNTVGAVALAEAIACLTQIKVENIAAHESSLVRYLQKKMDDIPDVILYDSADQSSSEEKVGVIPFEIEGVSHNLVAAILSYEAGIGVRNGCFCAHPYLLNLMNVSRKDIVKFRNQIDQGIRVNVPGLVRISFGCYNNFQEIDRLIDALEMITSRKWKGKYLQEISSGEFHPQGFIPDFQEFFSLENKRYLPTKH